jgi:ribosome-binding protein aMBF1 (putative translation factor)
VTNSTENGERDDEDGVALLGFYGLLGLSMAEVEIISRLAGEAWSTDAVHIAVGRSDVVDLLTAVDRVAEARRREVPTLALSDAEYDAVVGRHLRRAREERGMTQVELGDALGISQGMVSEYERARRRPTLRFVRRLAAAVRVPIGALVTESESAR